MTWLYALLGIVLLFIWIGAIGDKQKKRTERLKKKYDDAMASKNVKIILEAGREYYRALRPPGKINFGFDAESAIQNDMKAAGIN
jgi:hypothetical protein